MDLNAFPYGDHQTAEFKNTDEPNSPRVKVDIRARGKSRRSCVFPPIYVQWNKELTEKKGTVFHGLKGQDLKLSTHCFYTNSKNEQDAKAFDDRVAHEYALYKILKAFGLPSYNVRLAKILYKDPKNADKNFSAPAFFIEPHAEVAQRCHLTHIKKDQINAVMAKSDPRVYVPYLLARLIVDARDFYVTHSYWPGHNSEPFMGSDGFAKLVLPYDFNDSGILSAQFIAGWSFDSNLKTYIDLLKQGPFTRDQSLDPKLTDQQKLEWQAELRSSILELSGKLQAVNDYIDSLPLLPESKEKTKNYLSNLFSKLKEI